MIDKDRIIPQKVCGIIFVSKIADDKMISETMQKEKHYKQFLESNPYPRALKKVALPEGLKNKPKEFLVPIGFKF